MPSAMTTGQKDLRRRSNPSLKGHEKQSTPKPPGSSALQNVADTSESQKSCTRYVRFFMILLLFSGILLALRWKWSDSISSLLDSCWLNRDPKTAFDGGRFENVLHPEENINRPSKIQYHQWKLTTGFRRPDGVKKRVYLINDDFPGPTIEARPGDTLIIHVENDIETEGVAIHWHGLHMRNANEMDGTVGYSQCPIPYGKNFTYNFTLSDDQHGTFWYHAHSQVQRGDGLYGGLIIHNPTEDEADVQDKPKEERLMLIGDWYHRPADHLLQWYMSSDSFGNEPVPDSLIINDSGAYNCSKSVRARPVDCVNINDDDLPRIVLRAKTRYRFRIINIGSLAGIKLKIPGSELTVIELDGGHKVSTSDRVQEIGILYPGERVDFFAVWHEPTSRTFLEVALDEENFRYANLAMDGSHRYSLDIQPSEEPGLDFTGLPKNEIKTFSIGDAKSASPTPMPATVDITMVVYITSLKKSSRSNIPHGFMNQTSFKPQEDPPLPLMALPQSMWDKNQFVSFIPFSQKTPKLVDLVLNNLDDGSHPIHLHGHDFWVLNSCADGTYWGSYNPFDAPDGPPCGPFNLKDPMKRDTTFVPRRGYTVIRFLADNPGLWLLHCHMLPHLGSGMAMGIQVGGEEESAIADSWDESRRQSLVTHCPITNIPETKFKAVRWFS